MKVHYINILLFPLPLNVLVHNQRNHNNTTHHTSYTKPIKTHRTLCECELYAPSNYDNVPEMKEVMEIFNRQTSERFREHEKGMEDRRQRCKDQCDKDIQTIILKEKIQQELTERLSALETNININDIPTCVCEKSIADKVEKTCLKCGGVLGGGVAPELGLIGGTALYGISVWKPKAIASAIVAAQKAGETAGKAAGIDAGIAKAIEGILDKFGFETLNGISLNKIIIGEKFKDINLISGAVQMEYKTRSALGLINDDTLFSLYETKVQGSTELINNVIVANTKTAVRDAITAATKATETTTQQVTARAIETNKGIVEATISNLNTAIISSIVAIVVIVLVMLIIYLILRYRRKKKIKKKLQYIKLLKE